MRATRWRRASPQAPKRPQRPAAGGSGSPFLTEMYGTKCRNYADLLPKLKPPPPPKKTLQTHAGGLDSLPKLRPQITSSHQLSVLFIWFSRDEKPLGSDETGTSEHSAVVGSVGTSSASEVELQVRREIHWFQSISWTKDSPSKAPNSVHKAALTALPNLDFWARRPASRVKLNDTALPNLDLFGTQDYWQAVAG